MTGGRRRHHVSLFLSRRGTVALPRADVVALQCLSTAPLWANIGVACVNTNVSRREAGAARRLLVRRSKGGREAGEEGICLPLFLLLAEDKERGVWQPGGPVSSLGMPGLAPLLCRHRRILPPDGLGGARARRAPDYTPAATPVSLNCLLRRQTLPPLRAAAPRPGGVLCHYLGAASWRSYHFSRYLFLQNRGFANLFYHYH